MDPSSPTPPPTGWSPKRLAALELIRAKAVRRFDEPVQLASGGFSREFLDVKRGLAAGDDLRVVCEAMVELAADHGIEFDAVGGLTLGADQFAHGIALVASKQWFVIRKQPKGRGTDQWVEGAVLGPGVRVLLVEDVVTTGSSLRKAHERVVAEGAEPVLAITTVDRGDQAAGWFVDREVPYRPLLSYADLDLEPVT
jgi:orotate phosphoribosyltransferase